MCTNATNGHAASIRRIQAIIDHIEANLLEPLTPAEIAQRFVLSVSSLNHLFTVACDIPVMEYIRNRRLSLAGQELLETNTRVIDLALKYGYETPEAFTKAFSRLYGYPPSVIRRIYPKLRTFSPLRVEVRMEGGWSDPAAIKTADMTKSYPREQDPASVSCHTGSIPTKGGIPMANNSRAYRIRTQDMTYKEDWRVLMALAERLDDAGIAFHVDGKTMVFAHGLEFKLEKICLTFRWNDEPRVREHFGYAGKAKPAFPGFKYFDTPFEGMLVRCMFYGADGEQVAEDALNQNADAVDVDGRTLHVQSLEFYLANGDPKEELYGVVERWMRDRG